VQEPKIEVIISAEQIAARVCELGKEIARDYEGKDLVLIGVLKGSFVFLADLCRAIDLPLSVEFLGVASYGDETQSSGAVQITADLTRPLEGKHALLVEDIVDTGLTIEYLRESFASRHPGSLRLASLLHKPSRTKRPTTIDYLGFTIPDEFVIGYGLDYAQKYRNLPYVGRIVTKAATTGGF